MLYFGSQPTVEQFYEKNGCRKSLQSYIINKKVNLSLSIICRKEQKTMKMPEKIDISMFAPCGMNCKVCYKHCYHKKPCAGCLNSDKGKPEHCRKCKIENQDYPLKW